jgi:hypothetical protein
MFDTFLILAPFLILLIVALLRFTGCEIPESGTLPGTITLAPLPPGLSPGGLGPGLSVTFQPMLGGNPMSADELNATWVNAINGILTAPYPRDPSKPTITVSLKDASGDIFASTVVKLEPAIVGYPSFYPALNGYASGATVDVKATVTNVSPPGGQVQVTWAAVLGTITPNPLDSSLATYKAPVVTASTFDTVSFTIDADPAPLGPSSTQITVLP